MNEIFLKLLNMSITASVLALAVMLIRLLFKRMPKYICVLMWAAVAVRLLLPFSIESNISLLSASEPIPSDIIYAEAPLIDSGVPKLDKEVNAYLIDNLSPEPEIEESPLKIITDRLSVIWLSGVVLMLAYASVSSIRLKLRLREAVRLSGRSFLCDGIETPFIFGIIRLKIYIPSKTDKEDIELVLAHENAHISRGDHFWKPLGFALLSVYWFNPVLWGAYILLCRDIELATDEKAIKVLGEQYKSRYSSALLNCSVQRRHVAACPLAFGESGVKGRVLNVLRYKKPTVVAVCLSVSVCFLLGICFLTDPKEQPIPVLPQEANDGEAISDAVVTDVSGRYITVKMLAGDWENDGIIKVSTDTERNVMPDSLESGMSVRIVHENESDKASSAMLSTVYEIHELKKAQKTSPICDFKYRNNYYGGKTVTAYIGNDENVIIPSVIDGKPVTQIGSEAFKANMNIKSVYIPDTVLQISSGAFEDCMNLENVHLPVALHSCGDRAFYGCVNLKSLELPEMLYSIGNEAFSKCYALEYLEIPKSITVWGVNCFADSGVKEVVFAEGLEKIGGSAFADCFRLEKVTVGEGTELGLYSFKGCGRLPKEYREPWNN